MKSVLILPTKFNGSNKITPAQAVRIQHDGHSSYSMEQYVSDLVLYFDATPEEAEAVVKKELNIKN